MRRINIILLVFTIISIYFIVSGIYALYTPDKLLGLFLIIINIINLIICMFGLYLLNKIDNDEY